jgi:hypothetical protein
MKHPRVVYKYRDWDNEHHKKILTQNQLYFSSPKDFNDPFDCRIAPDLTLLESEEEIDICVRRMASDILDRLESDGVSADDFINSLKETLTRDIGKSQRDFEHLHFNSQDFLYGVLSFGGRWDSILMWSHYGNHHQGFCIGLDITKLIDFGHLGNAGPVIYQEDFPVIHPNNTSAKSMFDETHTKSKEWEYEDEYRYFKIFPDEVPDMRLVTIPNDFYSELIIGINCPTEHREQLVERAKEKSIPAYQAIKSERKFKIERTLIK